MTISRKVELIGGIATFLVALFASITVLVPRFSRDFAGTQSLGLVLFLASPFLVALGAYVHVTQRKIFGFVLLLLAGLFLILMLFVHLFGGVFYLYGLWGGLAIMAPSATANTDLNGSAGTIRS